MWAGIVLLAAVFGKMGGAVLAARVTGHPCKSLSTEKHESSVRALESALCV
jgi:hypothetical protein